MELAAIPDILDDLRKGRIVVVTDDEDRENEGDLVAAAQFATPDVINFMAKHGRGLICLPMEEQRLRELELKPMVSEEERTELMGGDFTVSIDAVEGTTTGISASDRAVTIQKAINPLAGPKDFARPGHVFPLRARTGGVLERAGHTEAAVDLARLAGLYPAGVICEVMSDSGEMARLPELQVFAKQHGLKLCTIQDLIEYRGTHETHVRRIAHTNMPTDFGAFELIAFDTDYGPATHLALVRGTIDSDTPVLVRVHSQCLTGDVFGSRRCDCGEQLTEAMRRIDQEGCGVILYLSQEGRGIGLSNKIRAYSLQDGGMDTVQANEHLGFADDLRDYGVGAQILSTLGIKKIRLMTNNPKKLIGLKGHGLEIVERVPLEVHVRTENRRYLETKRDKLGHALMLQEEEDTHAEVH